MSASGCHKNSATDRPVAIPRLTRTPARIECIQSISCSRLGKAMTDVTQLLQALDQGDARAAEQLLPLVYDELRRLATTWLAAEPAGNTLQPTALVHEAYLRLVGAPVSQPWKHR